MTVVSAIFNIVGLRETNAMVADGCERMDLETFHACGECEGAGQNGGGGGGWKCLRLTIKNLI